MDKNELKNKANEYYGKNAQPERKPIAKLLGAGHKDFSGYSEHYNQQYGFSYLLFPEPAENQIYSISVIIKYFPLLLVIASV